MSNPWFRMYAEFSHDPKVQMLTEAMQRRYMMIMCMRCSNVLVTLHETEIAFHLRISNEELAKTKALFVSKGFIDSDWNLLNWEKRQFVSDTSKGRVAKHRALQKEKHPVVSNGNVTLLKRNDNALDTDTDTDTDTDKKRDKSPAKLPTCQHQSLIDLYHEILPDLPAIRLMTDKRKKTISGFWAFVLTSKKADGTPRATTSGEATAWVRQYFERARDNDFLMGRSKRSAEHAGWECDLDFLLSDKGRIQVIEKTKDAA